MNFKKILSLSDYEKLISVSTELWSDTELSQFLVWDFLNVLSGTTTARDAKESFPRDNKFLVEKYKKYLFVIYFIDKVFQKLGSFFRKQKGHKKILFQGSRYRSIIREAEKHYSVGIIAQGRRDRVFAIRNFIDYIGTTELYQFVEDYFKDRDIKHLYELIKKTENKLKSIKPDYIVLSLDSRPIDRVIILAAKKLSIPTLVIQDGLQDLSFPLFDGKAADYILSWGEYFKNLQVEQNKRNPKNIYILGYPYLVNMNNMAKDKNSPYKVCYLAQDYERYNKDFLAVKLETVEQLFNICKKLGLGFICRPHPGDDRVAFRERLQHVSLTSVPETLEETFDKADIFISSSSTALLEATMRSKVSLQLMNYPIELDNFEKLGACSKSFETMEELEYFLKKIINEPNLDKFRVKFNNEYIETRYNLGQRFVEIIKEIRNNKESKL